MAVTTWMACDGCGSLVYGKRFARELNVCPECGHHSRLGAPERLAQLLDAGSAELLPVAPTLVDPLEFVDDRPYTERLAQARERTGLEDAVLCARGRILGVDVVVAAMDFRFLGGSMGVAVGEAITGAADAAARDRVPLILVTASGGARMQEGIWSLLQMAKTSQALAELDALGVPTISVITDPTYAGVAASFATLTDVIIAEPGARMGFTGPRVIMETIGERLPEGFQTAETLLRCGLIDAIRPRGELRVTLAGLLNQRRSVPAAWSAGALIRRIEELPARDAWQVVRQARDPGRPTALDYIAQIVDGFCELRGDRATGDCPAILGGVGRLEGRPIMIIAHQKGHTTAELIARDYGMAGPDGYRKAARLMRLAEKWRLPVITLIDTPGAHPGVAAEEGGQAIAIAESVRLMSQLRTPTVAVVTGEGGSGGALALAMADRVLCLAGAVYSVISPEGCAAILWRDRAHAPRAAAALRVDARELLRMRVVDGVIPEPAGGAHSDPLLAAELLRHGLRAAFAEVADVPIDELLAARRQRYSEIGRDNHVRA
ncbi:acetyl-CoA carboxylase carboxyl transferase subunit alpha [Nonomuraea sediminis]|uniref:acetyl-CoA carboxylase carboxyl transferase subunit alpha n=1 Tax=Nonomuraea sediminis TaxID=2835864 RepID=UPI0027DEDD44|nr:acetyl-CoA carboxylase carboxyl transferase subunit alpha [Nonomuraea sediminis]